MTTQRCPKCERKPDPELLQSAQTMQQALGIDAPEPPERQGTNACKVGRMTIDPVAYSEAARKANPLERFTLGDLMTIYGEDIDASARWAEEEIARHDEEYFRGSLAYRIEFDPCPTASGFRPYDEGFTMVVGEGTDECWGKALAHINEGHVLPALLRKEETYYCRLMSYGEDGRPYLWSVRKLEHHSVTGWVFSDWH